MVGFWDGSMFRAGVPEATVHEYRDHLLGEYNIGIDCPASLQTDWEILAEAETSLMKD